MAQWSIAHLQWCDHLDEIKREGEVFRDVAKRALLTEKGRELYESAKRLGAPVTEIAKEELADTRRDQLIDQLMGICESRNALRRFVVTSEGRKFLGEFLLSVVNGSTQASEDATQ